MLGLLAETALVGFGASLGAAIAAIGAGIGIGKIGASAMIVIAALIEGVALFAVIVCVLALFV